MIFLLKARRPEVYRERREIQHSAVWQPSHEELASSRVLGSDPEYREASERLLRRTMELEAGTD